MNKSNPRNGPPSGHHNGDGKPEKREVSGGLHVRGEIKAEFAPDIAKEYISSSRDNTARENRRYNVERVTLGFVILVAFLNLLQTLTTFRSVHVAEEANNTTLEAGRPWVGAQFEVSNFVLGETPTYTISYVNTGGRPAVITAAFNHAGLYEAFPSDPDKEYGPWAGGTRFIVPGQPFIMSNPGIYPLNDVQMSGSPKTIYVFGKVEYSDPRTNRQYWTHICVRYLPAYANTGGNGFESCHGYNDAK